MKPIIVFMCRNTFMLVDICLALSGRELSEYKVIDVFCMVF